ncbi:aldo/keto reductase [Mycetocola reblochoni]|uniref:Oxidoreductase of aldo/keto reductase family, subgroup 1 n=2 Tax=Mycetocola reblochoni TaxID=331618 RepID=A0A1R4K8Z9_9MICO|nr:aldo/keto reductase [Mycetocola reblochoni]RLP68077.1 aldo/keto reductase [Mycetocola reblochoni]SJN40592.1 oxidoreductase of aldo/keto reductase family, subgroup 1 [Mycetocola reblochoni REB411]
MTGFPQYQLADGTSFPRIGFGTYPLTGEEGVEAILSAIATGYRLIDTAVNYENEGAVGEAIRRADVPRGELIIQTKLPGRDHGYDETMRSVEGSLSRLGVERIDSYLIHWPNPSVDRYTGSWKAMVELQKDGRVGEIGVSNFTRTFIERLVAETGVLPAVNQVELHPYFPQEALVEYHAEQGILTQAWSPLGKGSAPYHEPAIVAAAEAHGITPAQVILRWHLERGVLPLPKSATPSRQAENLAAESLALTPDEVSAVTALGRPDGRLFGGDPNVHEEQ